jgi:hypothetical protein
MNFTQHALDKLERYGIDPERILEASKDALHNLHDTQEKSQIKIINYRGVLLALVIDPESQNLVTVYRTDDRTIENRRKGGRWT